jgi:hypothetical protein
MWFDHSKAQHIWSPILLLIMHAAPPQPTTLRRLQIPDPRSAPWLVAAGDGDGAAVSQHRGGHRHCRAGVADERLIEGFRWSGPDPNRGSSSVCRLAGDALEVRAHDVSFAVDTGKTYASLALSNLSSQPTDCTVVASSPTIKVKESHSVST